MRRFWLVVLAATLLLPTVCGREAAAAIRSRVAQRQPQTTAWHNDYYDAGWGVPVAVVVTPRAMTQTNWGWGVGGNSITVVRPQFQPGTPQMPDAPPQRFQPTPAWPSNTKQFGDSYIRGPR
jgi:hypothetical protein